MPYIKARRLFVPLLVLLLAGGCAGSCGEPVGYESTAIEEGQAAAYCPSGPDAGDAGDLGGDAGADVEVEPFEKPVETREHRRKFQEPGPVFASGGTSLDIGAVARPYMLGPKAGTAWLNEGEYFAVDGFLHYNGRSAPRSLKVELAVLVDFEPVPFFVEYVGEPGGWRARGEFSELGFSADHSMTLKRREPYNFSLVVPPGALGERGVHDLRLVALDTEAPKSSESTVGRPGGLVDERFTTYYGATRPNHPPEGSEVDIKHLRPSEAMRAHMFGGNAFLYPADRRSALKADADSDAVKLGGVLEADDGEITLEAMVAGTGRQGMARGRNFYVVLDGSQPIDGLRGLGHETFMPSDPDKVSGPYADRLSFTVELDDRRVHPIRLAMFRYPGCGFESLTYSPGTRVTNTLFIQRGR